MTEESLTEGSRSLDRRGFLELLGAGVAAAALQACTEPPRELIVPYVEQPPEATPGIPVDYATAFVLDGFATGILARTREGRPVKIEGNPLHPASLGGSGVFEQACLYHLYDPDRGRGVRGPDGEPAPWRAAVETLRQALERGGGQGVRILLEPTSSPLRGALLDRIRESHPGVGVHYHGAWPDHAVRASMALHGRPLLPLRDFRAARVVVSVGADFTASEPFHLRHARDFAEGRGMASPGDPASRLWVAEARPSPTGTLADHTLPLRDGDAPFLLAMLLEELGAGEGLAAALPDRPEALDAEAVQDFVRWAAADLREHRGEGVVLAGAHLSPAAHALARRANEILGNLGRTVRMVPSPLLEAGEASHGIEALAADMEDGAVQALAVLEANPVYSAPADLGFGDLLAGVDTTLHMGLYENETAARSGWHVPATHFLEAWGDARALDGTLSVVQPVIAPLYGGRSVDELLAELGRPDAAAEAPSLRDRLRSTREPEAWEAALRSGRVEGSASEPVEVRVDRGALGRLAAEVRPTPRERVEVSWRLDPRVHDGRFANNPWLLELGDPASKITWQNAAFLAPALAERLGVAEGDPVSVAVGDRSVELPAFPLHGHAAEAVTLSLGWGRRGRERTAAGRGVDVQALRSRGVGSHAPGTVEAGAGPGRTLARTQLHFREAPGREQIMEATLAEVREDPDFTAGRRGPVATLFEPPRPRQAANQWGMTIDLAKCTGCAACVQACQVENNIPVVGEDDVANGRVMHWIRIDRYVSGPPERPSVRVQPMLCQHCEKAPCEYVCPVNATVHSADGLNDMIYNRCVGTRFCSNNCPYKVRRFNWFDYTSGLSPEESLVLNPDVTVRARGVMEKCSYCVQRIRRAQIRAKEEDRPLDDGEVVTACQQACPTRAITFGDLADPDSAVSATRENDRIYAVLHELGTVPRTRYLARITNPRPELAARERTGREGEDGTEP